MSILSKMLKLLTDNYNKIPNGNISKLFNLIATELSEVEAALNKIERYRDIDQAKGSTLDKAGKNVLQSRHGNNDIDYRKFIKTKIIANLSGGEIEVINEVMSVLMGDAYLGVKETWSDALYKNEPAALVLQFDDDVLYKEIEKEYEEYENDFWYLDGFYMLDGTRGLDGGCAYDPKETFAQRMQTLQQIRESAKRIIAGGVRVYWEVPYSVISQIGTENRINLNINTKTQSEVEVRNSVQSDILQRIESNGVNKLDGIHLLNGLVSLDAKRDVLVNKVTVKEVSA